MSSSSSVVNTHQRRLDIQGLRAVAVLLVVLNHAGVPGFGGGYVGVDIFFVISGYVISLGLVRELLAEGAIKIRQFYARRARRILPPAFVTVVATLVAAKFCQAPLDFERTLHDARWVVLYIPNILFARSATDYLADHDPSTFQHFWSLGVEEQFYVVWPTLLLIVFLIFRKSRKVLIGLLIAVVFLSAAWCVHLTGTNQPDAFFLLPTRAWEFAIGALLTLAPPSGKLVNPVRIGAALVGAALIVASDVVLGAGSTFPGTAAMLPVAGAALVIWSGTGALTPISRLLALRAPVFIGEISYSIYLVHWPLLILPAAAAGHALSWEAKDALAIASIPIAYAMYRWVETPTRYWKPLAHRTSWASLGAAVVVTGLAFAGISGAIAAQAHVKLSTGETAVAAKVTNPPVDTGYVPENVRPPLGSAMNNKPILYKDGCHSEGSNTAVQGEDCHWGDPATAKLKIALFGDSHAAQWFPALRKLVDSRNWYVESYTKSACAPVAEPSGETSSCTTWRNNVVDHLKSADVDAVLLAGDWANATTRGTLAGANDTWDSELASTITTLASPQRKVVYIADTPTRDDDPNKCLSRHLKDTAACALPPTQTLAPAGVLAAERQAVTAAGGKYVDLDGYFCSKTTCPLVVGNLLVYREGSHITTYYAKLMSDVFGDAVESAVR